jgi:hypothetical protein
MGICPFGRSTRFNTGGSWKDHEEPPRKGGRKMTTKKKVIAKKAKKAFVKKVK